MKEILMEVSKRYEALKAKVENLLDEKRKIDAVNLMATIEDTFNGLNEAVSTHNNKWFQDQMFLVKILLDGLELQILEKPKI